MCVRLATRFSESAAPPHSVHLALPANLSDEAIYDARRSGCLCDLTGSNVAAWWPSRNARTRATACGRLYPHTDVRDRFPNASGRPREPTPLHSVQTFANAGATGLAYAETSARRLHSILRALRYHGDSPRP